MATSTCELTFYPESPDKPLKIGNIFSGPAASSCITIDKASEIPGPDTDPLILYIVAHGIPNGVIREGIKVSDVSLAKTIRHHRRGAATLIVWDVCFAKSFLKVAHLGKWPSNYVHIFSCQAHERTWQVSGKGSQKQTLFSTELRAALGRLKTSGKAKTWGKLEEQLQTQLYPIQTPSIHPKNRSRLQHFDLP
ncbi:MAG TPA: hypothetical protein VK550_19695 [Polyangiaceae bacterium]|nr:hypothetical protein [Polyangiaceae bacterium]